MPVNVTFECKDESRFFNEELDQSESDVILADEVYLGTERDEIRTRYNTSLGQPCPQKTLKTYPYPNYVDINSDEIENDGYLFLQGSVIRLVTSTGDTYTEEVRFFSDGPGITPAVSTSFGYIEALLPYRGIDYSTTQPPGLTSDLDFWWSLGTDPLEFYFIDRLTNPATPPAILIDPFLQLSSTQEDLLGNSTANFRTDGYNGVNRTFNDHNITTLDIERDFDTLPALGPFTWQDSGTPETFLGVPPRQRRATIDAAIAADGEPCAQVQNTNGDLRFTYVVNDATTCTGLIGYNPCYTRTRFTCQPI